MKTKITLAIIGGLLAVLLLAVASWAWRYYTAEIRGQVGAEEQIESAASRIARYDHFFNLCARVQTAEASLGAQQDRLVSFDGDSRERSRIQANIAGLKAQRARAINRYNADAAKSYTAGRFRDSSLPYQLSHTTKETTCSITQ